MTWQKDVLTYIKNVLILESAFGNTDGTKVVLLYSVSVYYKATWFFCQLNYLIEGRVALTQRVDNIEQCSDV